MQLEEGLSSCNVLSSARMHPKIWEPILLKNGCNNEFSPDEFLDHVVAEFSSSQVDKNRELNVYKYFRDFVMGLDNTSGRYNFFLCSVLLADYMIPLTWN